MRLPSSPLSWSFFSSLYSLAPSGSPLFFFRSHLWSHRSRISGITQGFLFRRCLPRSAAAVSVTALFKWVTMESRLASSSTSIARGANLPPIVAWKALITVGSFSFSRSNLILGWVGFPWIIKASLESNHHHVIVASNIFTWECSGSGSFNTWTVSWDVMDYHYITLPNWLKINPAPGFPKVLFTLEQLM